jgi:acetylornithine deacetylase/succinyl-diaminopimelate desuccinylase-like protein
MARIVLALDDLGSQLKSKRSPSSSLFSDVPSPTLMVGGLIKGGVKVNVVPGESTCTVDRRFMPEESVEEIEDEILSVVKRAASAQPGLRTETKRLAVMPPSSCPREAAIAQCLTQSVEFVNGGPPHIMGVSGFTDAHFFSELMPTVMYGPQILEKAHAEDEYVVLEHVSRAAKVLAVTALSFLGEAEE